MGKFIYRSIKYGAFDCFQYFKAGLEKSTGLSRQTISKHLKEFKDNELYKEHKAQFQILATSVLKKLFHLSMGGNVQASKIFLDAVGETNQNIKANQYIDKQQNNFNRHEMSYAK